MRREDETSLLWPCIVLGSLIGMVLIALALTGW